MQRNLTKIIIDLETFYGTKYSLRQQSVNYSTYWADPKFEIIGAAIKIENEPSFWILGDQLGDFLAGLPGEDYEMVAHNSLFDASILAWEHGWIAGRYVDTMGMASAVLPAMPHNLDHVGKYLKWPGPTKESLGMGLVNALNKRWHDMTSAQQQAYVTYALNDADITHYIDKRMRWFMLPNEMRLMDHDIRTFCQPVLELDVDRLQEIEECALQERRELFYAAGYAQSTLRKNAWVIEKLEALGVDVQYRKSWQKDRATGEKVLVDVPCFSGDDPWFLDLAEREDYVGDLARAKRVAHSNILLSRLDRLRATAACHGGKLPVAIKYHSAHTGRAGGGNKLNFQNLEKKYGTRETIVPPAGHKLVIVDSAGIEARVTAWFCGQLDLLEQQATGADTYSLFAEKIFNRPINKKDNPKERQLGKVAVLGLGYGMGADKFQLTLDLGKMAGERIKITPEEAQLIVRTYRETYPAISGTWRVLDRAIACMTTPGEVPFARGLKFGERCVILPSGRRMTYPGLTEHYSEKLDKDSWLYGVPATHYLYGGLFLENIVQAIARDVVMQQLLWTKDLGYNVAFHVHDELVCVVEEDKAEKCLDDVLRIMATSPAWCEDLPLDSDGGIHDFYTK